MTVNDIFTIIVANGMLTFIVAVTIGQTEQGVNYEDF